MFQWQIRYRRRDGERRKKSNHDAPTCFHAKSKFNSVASEAAVTTRIQERRSTVVNRLVVFGLRSSPNHACGVGGSRKSGIDISLSARIGRRMFGYVYFEAFSGGKTLQFFINTIFQIIFFRFVWRLWNWIPQLSKRQVNFSNSQNRRTINDWTAWSVTEWILFGQRRKPIIDST